MQYLCQLYRPLLYLQFRDDGHEFRIVQFQLDLFHSHVRIGDFMNDMNDSPVIPLPQFFKRLQIIKS